MAKRRRHPWAARAHAAGRRAAHGMKEPAIAAGGGIAASIVDRKFMVENETLAEHWWARGALLAVAGYLVRKQFPGWGTPAGFGLLGVAGYVLSEAYMAEDEKPKAETKGVNAGAVWGRRAWNNAGQVVSEVFGGNAAGPDPASAASAQMYEE